MHINNRRERGREGGNIGEWEGGRNERVLDLQAAGRATVKRASTKSVLSSRGLVEPSVLHLSVPSLAVRVPELPVSGPAHSSLAK